MVQCAPVFYRNHYMEILVSTLLLAISAFLLTFSALGRLKIASGIFAMSGPKRHRSPLLRLLMPVCSYVGMHVDALPLEKFKRRIAVELICAGLDDELLPSECIALGIALAVILASLGGLSSSNHPAACAVLGALCGAIYPRFWLAGLIRKRRREVECDLPNALDMITLSVEAGLDFAQAMAKIEARMKGGALRGLIARFNDDLRGGMTRRGALSELRSRSPAPSLRSISTLLIQADRFGTPIGQVLRAMSAELRSERFSRAERAGVLAQQMLLVPLVLFIMPTTFIVIFGPLVARFITGGFDGIFGEW